MIYTKVYTKVCAGDYNIRYIDPAGKWWKTLTPDIWVASRPMPIKSEYGRVEITIEENYYGKRIIPCQKIGSD